MHGNANTAPDCLGFGLVHDTARTRESAYVEDNKTEETDTHELVV